MSLPFAKHRFGQMFSTFGIVTILVFATTGQYAFGDIIRSDIAVDNAGLLEVTVGDSGEALYFVQNSGDCDPVADGPVTFSVNIPSVTGLSRDPTSLTIAGCGTGNGETVTFYTTSSTPVGSYEITVSVTDANGGSYSTSPAKFTLNVTAPTNSPPTIIVPNDQDIEGNTANGANVDYSLLTGELSANDNEEGDISSEIECNPTSGSFFALGGPHSISCTVEDSQGESDSDTFEITIIDTTDPVIVVPDNTVEEATGPTGATVAFSATATDLVDGDVPADCTPVSGSVFSLGTTPVSCSASDVAGNDAQGTFNVIVQDTTAPTLALPADMVEEATGPGGAAVVFSASASDLVDGTVPVDCSPDSGSTFPLGSTTVNCSAEDAAGNSASGSFSVTVQDTTPPELTLPADITEEATGPSGAVVNFVTSATDIVDGPVSVDCDPISGSTFSLGTTVVECSATDAAGNTAEGSFSVTVEDTTPPTLTLPGDMTVEATGPSGAIATFAASASDIVDGSTVVDCAPASGSMFALGATTVNCSSMDAAGNIATGSFMVTVVDTTPPSLDLPSDITIPAGGISGSIVTYSASGTDLVDGTVPVECVPASGSNFPIGTTTVNCSAEDNAGNIAEGSFTVSITIQKTGFYQPVDMNSYVNTAKAGSTVPLKFEVFGDMTVPATEISDISIVKTLKQKLTSCDPSAPTDEVETTATGGTMLRYDSTAGQFIYNWKTPLQKGCYTVTMTFLDDSALQALFKLK